MIDLSKCYYTLGTVDASTNDFTITGSKQAVTKNLTINTDGIYYLHLVDIINNTYDSYLELGNENWQIKGDSPNTKFDDQILTSLDNSLNVSINPINLLLIGFDKLI